MVNTLQRACFFSRLRSQPVDDMVLSKHAVDAGPNGSHSQGRLTVVGEIHFFILTVLL